MNGATPKKPYHHGDLKAALLAAAEEELNDKGVERFTLRSVARRAGVSHAAPAHHFKDTDAMLTALAAKGFERFLEALQARADAAASPDDRLRESGVGYVEFALDHPALFRLMFGSARPQSDNPDLVRAAQAGFEDLVNGISAMRGGDAMASPEGMLDVAATWSSVHGLATLLIDGRLRFLEPLFENDRRATLRRLVARRALLAPE